MSISIKCRSDRIVGDGTFAGVKSNRRVGSIVVSGSKATVGVMDEENNV